MRIKRETDYAIRCVVHLVRRPGEVASIEEISKGILVPKKFLAKILQKLAGAGIVKSHRGAKGGFELARDPALINFLDIMEAIQPVEMNICAMDDRLCSLSNACAVHPVWVEVREEVRAILAIRNFARFRAGP
ncbi:MAG: Rrf2 family transcriptional regulator [Nitrospiraceae bacterium]|nr:Rrf2 family transcriptional regulator [Nitrospiraceae bacterium]MDA8325045.1 Rrf2 family transcriptional regulator [Nitrospiraceae bacterium]